MQKQVQQFTSACEKARIFVENDMPIGVFHDFLMLIKGLMVDRMVAAHKEQEEQAKSSMEHGSDLEEAIPAEAPCESNCAPSKEDEDAKQ